MLRKLMFSLLILVSAAVGACMAAFAEVDIESISSSDGRVTVKGNATGAASEPVYLMIVRENSRGDEFWQIGSDEQIISKTAEMRDDVYYINRVNIDKDGQFFLETDLGKTGAPGGEMYRVICRQKNSAEPVSKLFYLPSDSAAEIKEAVEVINACNSTDEIKEILAETHIPPYSSILSLDINGYFSLLADKDMVYNALLNQEFSDGEAVKTEFNNAVNESMKKQVSFGKINSATANIGILDAALINNSLGADYSDTAYMACDFNMDKKIDKADVDAVIQYILESGKNNPSAVSPDPPETELKISSAKVNSGEMSKLTVSFGKSEPVTAMQFDIVYDSNVFEILDQINFDNALKDFKKEYKIIETDGSGKRIRFVMISAEPVSINNILSFRVSPFYKTAAGDYKISIADGSVQFHQDFEEAAPVPVACVNSTVTVTGKSSSVSSGGSPSGGTSPSGGVRIPVTAENQEATNTDPNPSSPAPASEGFLDLNTVGWAVDAINYLHSKGVVHGVNENTFEPLRNVTRAEFLKILLKAFELTEGGTEASFIDVSQEDWFYLYAAAAEKYGIVKGDDNGRFNPQNPITREDIAVLCARTLRAIGRNLSQVNAETVFQDRDMIADYAAEDIAELQKADILYGKDNNMFAPKDNATRAEACVIIYRLIK